MRSLFRYVLAAGIMLFSTCNNTKKEDDKLQIAPTNLKFQSIDTNAQTIEINTNVSKWAFRESAQWIKVKRENGKLTVTVDDHVKDNTSRYGFIVVIADNLPWEIINIEQISSTNDGEEYLDVTPKNLKFNTVDRESKSFNILTNAATWTFHQSADWFHPQKNKDQIIITVDDNNESENSRFGTIIVSSGELKPVTLNIEQFGEKDNLDVSPKSLKFSSIDGTEKSLVITTNVSTWAFEQSAEWFHVKKSNDKLMVTVDENTKTDGSRSGTITITAGKAPEVVVSIEQTSASSSSVSRVEFEKSGEVILNPGQGWILYGPPSDHNATLFSLATTGYHRFDWSTINPSEGVYRWQFVDEYIDNWARQGKQFSFGVMNVNTAQGSNYTTPQWVFDKGAKYTRSNGSSGHYIPVWDDPIYVAECKKFAEALAAKYDGNPNIAFIDIRNYGNWGEMHMIPFTQNTQRLTQDKVQSLLLQPYIDYFKKTPIIKCWGLHFDPSTTIDAWAVNNGLGLRCDGIMDNDGGELKLAIGKLLVIWEFDQAFRTLEKGSTPWIDTRFIANIKNHKPNFIGMGHWGDDARYMLSKKPDLIKEAANLMGYTFSMKVASYRENISAGESHEVSVTIENSGITTMLTNCVIELVLLRNDDVVSSHITNWNAKTISGSSTVTFVDNNVKFENVSAGLYQLAIGFFLNKDDQKPTYNLDNKGRTNKGFYTIGNIRID